MYKFEKVAHNRGHVVVARRHFDQDQAMGIAQSVVPEGWTTGTSATLIDEVWLILAHVEAN